MRLTTKLLAVCLLVACLGGAAWLLRAATTANARLKSVAAQPRPEPNVMRARADVFGPPGSGIEGVVYFTESPVDKYTPVSEVKVVARVKGLTPGFHGFHIHEIGTCDPPSFLTAGGHFDPGPFGNSLPDANHPYHTGDLAALEANNAGVAHLEYTTSRFTLRQNPGNLLSVFDANGSTVIVHLNPDLGINGVTGASGGPRIACGIIRPIEPTAP